LKVATVALRKEFLRQHYLDQVHGSPEISGLSAVPTAPHLQANFRTRFVEGQAELLLFGWVLHLPSAIASWKILTTIDVGTSWFHDERALSP